MTTTPIELRTATSGSRNAAFSFRSTRGAIGALLILLALPITIAFEIIFPGSNETVIHAALAAGTFMVGVSMSDFAAPRGLTVAAFLAAALLAGIFLAQSLAALTNNETLRSVAFSPALGGWAETACVLVVMAWFVALAAMHGRGITMIAGVLSALLVAGLSVWAVV